MNRRGNLRSHHSVVLLAMCASLLFPGCITYRSKETPRIPYLQEDLRYSDQAPPIRLVHRHSHLVNGASTQKREQKATEGLYTERLNTVLKEFPFLRNAEESRFDAPYTLEIESVNDEQVNMGLLYLTGATFLLIPSKVQVGMTVSATLNDNENGQTIARATSIGGTKTIVWLVFVGLRLLRP